MDEVGAVVLPLILPLLAGIEEVPTEPETLGADELLILGTEDDTVGLDDGACEEDEELLPQQLHNKEIHTIKLSAKTITFLDKIQNSFIVNCRSGPSRRQARQ
ncbi:MAG: hypothetical protein RR508_05955 [Oscillospiraceae bacterium]